VSSLALVIATVLVVTGAVAAAGTAVVPARAFAAVTSGVVMLVVAESASLTASATMRSLATAGVPLVVALLAIVVLGWRPAMLLALTGAVVAGPVRQMLDDPFHDPECVLRCNPNPLVLAAHPGAADVTVAVGVGLLLAGLLAPARRRNPRSLYVAVLGLAAAPVVITGSLLGVILAACASVAVLVADLVRTATVRGRLAQAVAALATTDDAVPMLAAALGGRPVFVGYPISGGRLVDRDGRPMSPPSAGWTVLDIAGPGGVVAQLRTDLTGIVPAALGEVIRGPVRLALENNRLSAEAAVRSQQIRASAGRLVEVAEQGRRRLERDLHDGAQRHVLTLGMAVQAEDLLPESVRREAAQAIHSVLDQLRDVAHGIRPPQLDTGGLARGLADLADRSPVPLEVVAVPDGLDATVAEAAYRLVEDVLRSATGHVTLTSTHVAGGAWELTVTSAQDGELPPWASDRFLAVGGSVSSESVGPGWRHVGAVPPRLP
jgi:signal transduction histidine kinase